MTQVVLSALHFTQTKKVRSRSSSCSPRSFKVKSEVNSIYTYLEGFGELFTLFSVRILFFPAQASIIHVDHKKWN